MTRPPDLSLRNIALAPGGFSRAAATFVGLRLAAALASLVAPLARAVDWPGPAWSESSPAAAGMAEAPLAQARDYALTGGGSGVITRHGKIVLAWGDLHARYDLKSSSKSIGVTALGLALADGLVTLDDPAVRHHPAFATPPEGNRDTGWPEHVTLRHLANQTAGFEKPGGYGKLLFAPGTKWHYSLLWWNNGDGTLPGVPRDAFWSWGLYDSLIVVIPSLDVVVARAGKSWARTQDGHYDVLQPFLTPIVAAVVEGGRPDRIPAPPADRPAAAPYPPSRVISTITWAPVSTIVRQAPGGDNWPLTWADDDALYTAYGDGRGFQPFVPKKLSLGFARVTGGPADFAGVNLRAEGGEFPGDGQAGRKASGLLMVDGVLYLLARNLGNAQLAWSRDHGATWVWADWKFTSSFGCPTFLNFGRNYAGARDEFVYVYSPDSDSAYAPADRMVLARVHRERLTQRAAYAFFAGLDPAGHPRWAADIDRRAAVFAHPGNCYRGGITYHAGLRRYLWCQVLPHSRHPQGPRFQGGFGIYDAPEPWGPWTTVFFTADWDVGPGESSSLPTKWMSADNRTVQLVFSGDDAFSVREGTLVLSTGSGK
jgi:hypothetical protein